MSPAPTQDRVLGHADESDGIEEYDNRLPTWWLGLFYLSMIWGVAYAVHYHFIGHRSQAGDYDAEMSAAAAQWPEPTGPMQVEVTPELIAAGEQTFMGTCVACHGADLHGGIGPDLTDDVWIHGGTMEAITRTITEGVLDKGMPAWGHVLGPQKVAEVAAYVQSKSQQGG